MFDRITKKEYWSMPKTSLGELKHIQDTWIWSQLVPAQEMRTLEVGGGLSRVLPASHAGDVLWNMDEFTSSAGGPAR